MPNISVSCCLTSACIHLSYVSLQTLSLCLPHDLSSVLRHRSTILDCLRDPDISIRRRALELSFAIVNETNVRVMVRELLAFLEIADVEFKTSMVAKLFDVAKWYAPNRRWHLDTLIRVLKLVCELCLFLQLWYTCLVIAALLSTGRILHS